MPSLSGSSCAATARTTRTAPTCAAISPTNTHLNGPTAPPSAHRASAVRARPAGHWSLCPALRGSAERAPGPSMPEAAVRSASPQAAPPGLYCTAPRAARGLMGAVVPPRPAPPAWLPAGVQRPSASVRRVTLRAATQPPLGGELPPTALTAETMLMAFRVWRRVPIIIFLFPFVILCGVGGLHSYF